MSENDHVDHDSHGHNGLAASKEKIEDALANLPLDIPIYLFTPKNPQGYTPNMAWVQKPGVQLTPDGYIKQDQRHRTNRPGVYSAGDVEGGYKQIITAAGQGAGGAQP